MQKAERGSAPQETFKDKFAALFRGKLGILRIASIAVALAFLAVSIVAFVRAGAEGQNAVARIFTVLGGVLMIAVAAEVLLIVFTLKSERPCFFLYDPVSKRNLPASVLTPALVSKRMDAYLARIAKTKGQLWLPGYLESCNFGKKNEFRPVTAYKMLLDLVETDSDGAWRCFCASSPATVEWIADALAPYEPHMMKDVLFIKANCGTDATKIRDCLLRNAEYLRRRMLAYVAENINAFKGTV